MSALSAPELLRSTLTGLGVDRVFALPGTQNMALLEALRASSIEVVVPTHELAATFMAGGHWRATGRLAVVASIRGPGFAYTLPAMAECSTDSVPLLQLTTPPPRDDHRRFLAQDLDQAAMARPVTKWIADVRSAGELTASLGEAARIALDGDPGPVLLQIDPEVWTQRATPTPIASPPDALDASAVDRLAERLRGSARVVLFVGMGAVGADVTALAERLGALVLSGTSGRGIVPESHPLSLGFECSGLRAAPMNEILAEADLVLALGCRFSQNATRGFGLEIDPERLVHVDASETSLGANLPAGERIRADARAFVTALLARIEARAPGWSPREVSRHRERALARSWDRAPEPRILDRPPAEFFDRLRAALPACSHVVTDSGLHQLMARRYLRVECPQGLVVPAGLQSMGFALPTAIGMKRALPGRPVVALLGDGGMLMSGMELATAVRLGLDLPVVVINDASYGLIRRSQENAFGAAPTSVLDPPDFRALAAAVGADHHPLGAGDDLGRLLAEPGVRVVEVVAGESTGQRVDRAKGRLKRALGGVMARRLRLDRP